MFVLALGGSSKPKRLRQAYIKTGLARRAEPSTVHAGGPTIAIYHASLKTFARARGQSATGAAAYRMGIAIHDARTGRTHDYRRKSGVEKFKTYVPDDAPAWAREAGLLWNAAEAAEKRSNSIVARELEVALPAELTPSQRGELAEELACFLVDRYRVAVTASIHSPGKQGDQRNHHVHLLFATRALGPDGFGAKTRVLDERVSGPQEVRWMREKVAALTNGHLRRAGVAERVDHRTLKTQAVEAAERGDVRGVLLASREPTVHCGPAATAMARRGVRSDRATRHSTNIREITSHQTIMAKRYGQFIATTTRPRESRSGAVPLPQRLRRKAPVLQHVPSSPHVMRQRDASASLYAQDIERAMQTWEIRAREILRHSDWLAHQAERLLQIFRERPEERRYTDDVWDARCAFMAAYDERKAIKNARREARWKVGVAENDLRTIDESKPSAWRLPSRREWAAKRRAERSVVAAARADLQTQEERTYPNVERAHHRLQQAYEALVRRRDELCTDEGESSDHGDALIPPTSPLPAPLPSQEGEQARASQRRRTRKP